jgi:hypothetical protein
MRLVENLMIKWSKSFSGAYSGNDPRLSIDIQDINYWILEWGDFIQKYGQLGTQIDEISEDQAHLNLDKKWLAHFIYGFGHFTANASIDFPELSNFILKNKNKISLVFFSTLENGKNIPPHKGNNPFVLRTQIGVSVINPTKTGLRVGDDVFQLGEGEVCFFDDTLEHDAWNYSGSPRTVLIIDVLKKPPFFLYYFWKKKQKEMYRSAYVQNAIKKIKN